jgi:acetyltransferase-like isoleucine patch superfamily enzyme
VFDVAQARLLQAAIPSTVTLPDLNNYRAVEVNAETARQVYADLGLRIETRGHENVLMIHKDLKRFQKDAAIVFERSKSIVIVEENSKFHGHIALEDRALCVLMGQEHVASIWGRIYSKGIFFWGRNSSSFGFRIWADGGKRLIVGDDCMFSERISARTSDHHAIVDLESMRQINSAKDVIVGRHVWLGVGCTLMPGAEIGAGSIIGAESIVTRSVPRTELWAGVPARGIRKNVSWVRSFPADPLHLAALEAELMLDSTLPEGGASDL